MIIYSLIGLILFIIGIKNWLFFIVLFIYIIYGCIRKTKKIVLYTIIGMILGLTSTLFQGRYNSDQHDFTGIVIESKNNYFIYQSGLNKYYVSNPQNEFEIYDVIKIKGDIIDLVDTSLEGEFSFCNYLKEKNVSKELKINNYTVAYHHFFPRNKIKNALVSNFDYEASIFIKSLLFNDFDSDFRDLLINLNLYSLFAVTSIHLLFLYQLIRKILLGMTNNKKLSILLALVAIFPLIALSSYKISIIKSICFIVIKELMDKQINKKSIIGSLGIFCLFFNNNYLYTSGFLYVFIIPFFIDIINTFIKGVTLKYRKITMIVLIQLLFSIFFIYFNGQYNILSIIYFLLFYSLSTVIYCLSAFSLYIFPLKIVNVLSKWTMDTLICFNKIDSIIYFKTKNIVLCLLLLILFFVFIYFCEIRNKKSALITTIVYVSLIFSSSIPLDAYCSQYVIFLNVGQGDCALIHNKHFNVLIDTGGIMNKDLSADVLVPFFNHHHIKKIDCVFISHEDFDHNGALPSLIRKIDVEKIIIGSTFDEIQIGDISFKNLNQYYYGTDDNLNSSVIYFQFIGKTFLFMGDAPKEIEEKIITDNRSLNVDIIKIGHHGSSSSSSYSFLKAITPQEAVISVGVNNKYHHPHENVISTLNALNIKIRRTDIEGSIEYSK